MNEKVNAFIKDLPPELQEKAKDIKTQEELMEFLSDNDIELPDEALEAGATVVGTGRSDYPNQINNVLAFPGLFRGALDVRARDINEAMKRAASFALAGLVSEEELSAQYILPRAFDKRVGPTVAAAVAKAARESGTARL